MNWMTTAKNRVNRSSKKKKNELNREKTRQVIYALYLYLDIKLFIIL